MKENKYIVFLGFNSFPYGLAEAQKLILISKSLLIAKNNVVIICRNGSYSKKEKPELKPEGSYENIEYVYASGSCFRDDRFLIRRLNELKGRINEILQLRKRKKEKKLDCAILSTRSFSSIIFYSLLSKYLDFKIILNYVEYYSGIKKQKHQITKRLNDYFFDRFAPSIADGILPISEFLINQVKKTSPQKKYLKIPVLTDFDRYKGIQKNTNQKYFLFCGYAAYKEVIRFIIDSFELLENSSYSLYLVVNGRNSDLTEIVNYVNKKNKNAKIKLFSNLSEIELFTYYHNACALLIPLRPTLQDIARFPHKIGEYLASGNLVISTAYGEVNHYFTDMENMLLAETFDINVFAEKMRFVINHPEESKAIGLNGKKVAQNKFDYQTLAEPLNNFLNKL